MSAHSAPARRPGRWKNKSAVAKSWVAKPAIAALRHAVAAATAAIGLWMDQSKSAIPADYRAAS
ncbi:MAG: hypothetical protein WDM81_08160 [Rhizomicrobium sp.]